MKKIYLLFIFIALAGFGFGQVFITELADPNNNANARYIELYNAGSSEVVFTESNGWRIDKYVNANTDVGNTINLTGTIASKGFYIIAYNYVSGTFQSVYGFAPNQLDGVLNGVAGGNGDDPLELVDGTGSVVDQFGVPGTDGTSTSAEYEDGRAERVATVVTGQATYADANWNTWSDGSGGDIVQTQSAPDDFDPGEWIGASGSPSITLAPTSLTGFTYLLGNGPSSEQIITAEGSDLTNDIVLTAPTNYEISETSGSGYTTPITLTQSGGTVSTTTIYVRLKSELGVNDYNSENITATSIGATQKVVSCSGNVYNGEPTNHVTGFSATANGSTTIDLAWTENDGSVVPDGYLIIANTGTVSDPVDGTDPADDTDLTDGSGSYKVSHGNASYSFSNCSASTTYNFKIYPYTNSGSAINYKTDGSVPEDDVTTAAAPVSVAPTAGVVYISEICDAGDYNYEFLELYNNSSDIIDLGASKLIRLTIGGAYDSYVWDFAIDGSGDKLIPANGIIIIARSATQTEFESEWGSLPEGVNFNGGHTSLYFGSSRQWALKDGGTSNTNDGSEIDATNRAMTDGAGDFQYPTSTWNTETEANATPGTISATQDPAAYLWDDGGIASNWADADNWNPNVVPGSNTNVTIDASTDIIIDKDETADCYNLTVNGSLTIKSDETSTGSLIINGTHSGTGTTTVERYFEAYSGDGDGWHTISPPVASMTVLGSDFAPGDNDDLYKWDEVNYTWKNYKANSFDFAKGEGYLVAFESLATKDFVGTLNSTDEALSNLTKTSGKGEGWHLLGNPFPSAIKWNDGNWAMTAVTTTAKIYNESAGNYSDITANGIIPSTNGFYVEVTSATNAITIPAAARVHDATNNYKATEIAMEETLKLTVSNDENTFYDVTRVAFNADAKNAFDWNFDSHKMYGQSVAPQLWTVIEGEEFSTNTLPYIASDVVLPLNFKAGVNTTYHINAEGLESFFGSSDIYLEDKTMETMINLRDQSVYSFQAQTDDASDRFQLHFYGVNSTQEIEDANTPKIYAYNNTVNILFKDSSLDNINVKVFNAMGQKVYSTSLHSGENSFKLNEKTGVYIIQVQSAKGVSSQKVMIK